MIKYSENSFFLSRNIKVEFPIYFTQQVFSANNIRLSNLVSNRSVLVIVDENVNHIYGKLISNYFSDLKTRNNTSFDILALNAVETSKSMNTIVHICSKAKEFGLSRDSVMIGIGGGVLLDIVGLAASLFRRKINYIRIPTTLIGIVDAGIGIKVGVNFETSKNFLGNFYAPLAVFNDQTFLRTLNIEEIRCGLYEMVKMAIIKSDNLFDLLEKNLSRFLNKEFDNSTDEINRLAIQLMLEELEPNLFEKNLKRLVDFGHAFSSYIESYSNYEIPHGMAIGIDMLICSHIAKQREILAEVDFDRINKLFHKIGVSKVPEGCTVENLHNSLDGIRKHRAGNLNLPLPTSIGSAIFTNTCKMNEVKQAVEFIKLNK